MEGAGAAGAARERARGRARRGARARRGRGRAGRPEAVTAIFFFFGARRFCSEAARARGAASPAPPSPPLARAWRSWDRRGDEHARRRARLHPVLSSSLPVALARARPRGSRQRAWRARALCSGVFPLVSPVFFLGWPRRCGAPLVRESYRQQASTDSAAPSAPVAPFRSPPLTSVASAPRAGPRGVALRTRADNSRSAHAPRSPAALAHVCQPWTLGRMCTT